MPVHLIGNGFLMLLVTQFVEKSPLFNELLMNNFSILEILKFIRLGEDFI